MFSRSPYSLTSFSKSNDKNLPTFYEVVSIEILIANQVLEQHSMIDSIDCTLPIAVILFERTPFSTDICNIGYYIEPFIVSSNNLMFDVLHIRAPSFILLNENFIHNETYIARSFVDETSLSLVSRNPTGRKGIAKYTYKYFSDYISQCMIDVDLEWTRIHLIRIQNIISGYVDHTQSHKEEPLIGMVIESSDIVDFYTYDETHLDTDLYNINYRIDINKDLSYRQGGYIKIFHIKGGITP